MAPAFAAKTTRGDLTFPDDHAGSWVIFFSHIAWLRTIKKKVTFHDMFVIDPAGVIRTIVYHPLSLGRHVDELRRVVVVPLQTADTFSVATPADWFFCTTELSTEQIAAAILAHWFTGSLAVGGGRVGGTTAPAEQRAATAHRLDTDSIDLIAADPSRLTDAPEPILIDEWKHWPPSWDFVRRAVDDDPRPGRFILTGSTCLCNRQTHSGAGRIVSPRMRPLTLPERGEVVPAVSLTDLLSGQAGKIAGESAHRLEDYTEPVIGGGFPGMLSLSSAARAVQLDGHIRRIVERDFPEAGREVRNPAGLLRWMRAFAAATSSTATFETIRDAAATGHANPPPRSSTIPYRDTLESIWISDPVPAWHPIGVRIDRLTEGPEHHLADPAPAAALLGASAQALLTGRPVGPAMPRDGHLLGALFESLVALSVRVFAQAVSAEVHHLRTKSSAHEVDFIVTGRGERSIVGMEVTVSPTVKPDDVRHLHWLKAQMGDQLTDMVLVNTGAARVPAAGRRCGRPARAARAMGAIEAASRAGWVTRAVRGRPPR